MKLRAVLFDMGGTIETFGYTREMRLQATAGIQKYLQDAGIDLGLSDETLLEVVTVGLQKYHEFCLNSLIEFPPERVWREFILAEYEFDQTKLNEIAEEMMVYVETRFYFREMRPEIPAVLKAIKEMGLKIGLISNVNSLNQVPLNLEKYHIKEYFNPIVLSSEYGIRKPDPSIFHYAARLMNVPTSSCVYIGDRIARDVIGAQKAGFKLAIQIQHDYDHGEEDTGAVPDAFIGNMTELLDILKRDLASPQKEPASHIRALLFDAGDILYYRPRKENRFVNFLKELDLDEKWSTLPGKKELTRKAFTGQISHDDFHLGYLELLGITDPDLIDRGKTLLAEENLDVEFFEGVKDTLLKLKENGYLLGIITNTANSISNKLSWFEQGGFGNVWDSIISSMEIGVVKPFPEIYHAALAQLDLQADQAVFVGHRISELDGAHAAGLTTIAFNYDKGARADYYINDFCELLQSPAIAIADGMKN
jgi:HAD superfamily hydrolase (TIGR01549 family)/HAD superfamily hydrolase (TIGR01509 family)